MAPPKTSMLLSPQYARHRLRDEGERSRLARFLAFGIDMRVEQAIASIEAADGARRRWTDEHGLHEPSDGELLTLLTELVRQALADAHPTLH